MKNYFKLLEDIMNNGFGKKDRTGIDSIPTIPIHVILGFPTLKAYLEKRKEKKRKEFAAKLKYGKNWHYYLYPGKYTSSRGPG